MRPKTTNQTIVIAVRELVEKQKLQKKKKHTQFTITLRLRDGQRANEHSTEKMPLQTTWTTLNALNEMKEEREREKKVNKLIVSIANGTKWCSDRQQHRPTREKETAQTHSRISNNLWMTRKVNSVRRSFIFSRALSIPPLPPLRFYRFEFDTWLRTRSRFNSIC